ncbi:MAG: NUDIX domain-containing protein [Rickettsiales bacterium]|jgi:8-oxo-dGTP pyrophosphatase MutT (NUDIX family)|nr:NUDIX domain-containing protein [Rickettsiales bacterium]
MVEFLDIYDANGRLVGQADRNVAHAFGLWHKTIHCWVVWDGKLVFQRRGSRAGVRRDNLYVSASGHVAAGETIPKAFAREVEQEIGIAAQGPKFLDEFVWVKDMKKADGSVVVDRAFSNVFWAEHSGKIEDFKFNDGEVHSVVAIDLDSFADWSFFAEGEIDGLEWDGKNVRAVKIAAEDFLLNDGETIAKKYGMIADMIQGWTE